jgi:hypothetical protein
VLDQKAQRVLQDFKEAHAEADACVEACTKLQADLEQHVSDVSRRELTMAGQEWELHENEEESACKLQRENNELQALVNDLSTCDATVEAEEEYIRKTHEDLFTHELTIISQEGTLECHAIELASKEKELAAREKWLADAWLQELATTRKTMEELRAAQAVEAQKVWDFLGQTEMTLVPLSFSPMRSGDLTQEVSNMLPVLESAGAKMLKLEEVVDDQLEVEGHVLALKVAKHVLMCFGARTLSSPGTASRRPPRSWMHGSSACQKTRRASVPTFVSTRTSGASM